MIAGIYNDIYINDRIIMDEAYTILWKIKKEAIEKDDIDTVNEINHAMVTINKIRNGAISIC